MTQLFDEDELAGKVIKEVVIVDDSIIIHLDNNDFFQFRASLDYGDLSTSQYDKVQLEPKNYWEVMHLIERHLIPKEKGDKLRIEFLQQEKEETKKRELDLMKKLKEKYE